MKLCSVIGMNAAFVRESTHQAWRYAQHRVGLQLHLVELYADGSIGLRAECGYWPSSWAMTINVPLAHACRKCSRKVLGGY